jgi:error-prone DNA polymerase
VSHSQFKPRFRSLEDFISRTGVRRSELVTLAEIGALNSFGYDRRTALWQIEEASRKVGDLFHDSGDQGQEIEEEQNTPLPSMTLVERVFADYQGTGLTIGPHPMSFRRSELTLQGVLRSADLPRVHHGRRIKVAGTVITRQRPSAAKGFVFLSLEDETGIANIIISPHLFTRQKLLVLKQSFLLVEGRLQIQDNVISVKAERCQGLWIAGIDIESHDFH